MVVPEIYPAVFTGSRFYDKLAETLMLGRTNNSTFFSIQATYMEFGVSGGTGDHVKRLEGRIGRARVHRENGVLVWTGRNRNVASFPNR